LLRTDYAGRLNFFKDSSAERIQKIIRMQETADFQPGAGLHKHRTEQAQGIALHLLAVWRLGDRFRFHVMRAKNYAVSPRDPRAS